MRFSEVISDVIRTEQGLGFYTFVTRKSGARKMGRTQVASLSFRCFHIFLKRGEQCVQTMVLAFRFGSRSPAAWTCRSFSGAWRFSPVADEHTGTIPDPGSPPRSRSFCPLRYSQLQSSNCFPGGAIPVFVSCWGASKLICSTAAFLEQQEFWPLAMTCFTSVGSVILISFGITALPGTSSAHEPLLCNSFDNNTSALDEAGAFSRMFFTWVNPLLALGREKLHDPADVPSVASRDRAASAYSEFFRVWESQENPTILRTLAKCHFQDVSMTGILALIKAVIASCSPLFLKYFNFSAQSLHTGYVLVALLSVFKLFENLSQRHWFFQARRVGVRVRSSLISAIYEKALRLSHEARRRHSTGEITSYISVDCFRIGEFSWWIHQSWAYPLQILIALGILVDTVGWATLPAVFVIAITAITQVPLAKAQQDKQRKLLMAQDERLRFSAAVLSNMKTIKLQAWDNVFNQRIRGLRDEEFKWLSSLKSILTINILVFWLAPVLTASVVFLACVPLGITLDATVIFTVLATVQVMADPLYYIPGVLSAAIQAKVSLDRVSKYLQDEELQTRSVSRPSPVDAAVSIENGSWTWGNEMKATVTNISLQLGQAELVAVCGRVGSGKSILLLSILGETERLSGKVTVQGRVAYVGQTAWIQSGTVRDNILFGLPFEESRYQEVLGVCCLLEDLSSFSHGDLTEIGERGLNLSGGQKQRVQLARALYDDADVYLLDDPFSALDSHTASKVFENCVLGALSKKSVILVTHQAEFLRTVKTVLVMEAGQILNEAVECADPQAIREVSRGSQQARQPEADTLQRHDYCQLTQQEERESGDLLGLEFLKKYITISRSFRLFIGVYTGQVLYALGTASSYYWLAVQVANPAVSLRVLVSVFAAISITSTSMIHCRSKLVDAMGLRASQTFFSELTESLFQAPMALFDCTPLGRMLSRLSSDLNLLDVDVPISITYAAAGKVQVLNVLLNVSMVTWQVLFVAIPMVIILAFLVRYYLQSARELVRINGIAKAPLLNKTGETLNGAVTIRAFRKQLQFKNDFMQLVDADAKVIFHIHAAHEWLALRVELIGASMLSAIALLLVLSNSRIAPGLAGLSLSYALALNAAQLLLVEGWSNMASYIVSVERIAQYMHLPREAPQVIQSCRPSSTWPEKGRIELQDLQVRYQGNSPIVLKGISCILPEGHRIGIVGRTGSGKTTLVSAIFRLVEPAGGRILIDGLDISSIGLFDLRSSLGVIPQEAFLFKGTVRLNLDPAGIYADSDIWQALQKCRLITTISTLDAEVCEEGGNWSTGQRQLFCLARVLLKKSKVVVLDEATASIDLATDATIQKVIREVFINCTVITVAHRIPTILDSDIVLCLEQGSLVDYGRPDVLLLDANSVLAKLEAESSYLI